MTYSVMWTLPALQEVDRLAAADPDPAWVRKAADWMDYTLRRIPLEVGESRPPGRRVWYADVLGVYYHVDWDAATVRVIAAGPSRRPRS